MELEMYTDSNPKSLFTCKKYFTTLQSSLLVVEKHNLLVFILQYFEVVK